MNKAVNCACLGFYTFCVRNNFSTWHSIYKIYTHYNHRV